MLGDKFNKLIDRFYGEKNPHAHREQTFFLGDMEEEYNRKSPPQKTVQKEASVPKAAEKQAPVPKEEPKTAQLRTAPVKKSTPPAPKKSAENGLADRVATVLKSAKGRLTELLEGKEKSEPKKPAAEKKPVAPSPKKDEEDSLPEKAAEKLWEIKEHLATLLGKNAENEPPSTHLPSVPTPTDSKKVTKVAEEMMTQPPLPSEPVEETHRAEDVEKLMKYRRRPDPSATGEGRMARVAERILSTKEPLPLPEEEEETDESDEIETVVEHLALPEQSALVRAKGKEAASRRRPLADPEAMPKKKPVAANEAKKVTQEKKTPAPPPKTAEMAKQALAKLLGVKEPEVKKEPPKPLTKEEKEKMVRESLDGMYDVYKDPELAPERRLERADVVRYAVLFLCIFGFFTAGFFVFHKLYEYHRAYVVNTGLQELVSSKDRFQDEYLKKNVGSIASLTPEAILNGEKEEQPSGSETFTDAQQNLVNKIGQLKKINPDTAGWIKISGTVVNYPVVYSEVKNYYLRRDFYGKTLSGGTLYIDERNSPVIAENRNTVIYGHNMVDGSMFASVHDFAHASVFYSATIEITTEDGIFIYKPFSVHKSNAYDNYFETDFATDEDFIGFCEEMTRLSLHATNVGFDKDSQILTLSTCTTSETATDDRFAVHAILTQVIR